MLEETTEKPKTPLQLAEDRVSNYLNGGSCTISLHPAMTQIEKLLMFKMLRLEMPHQATSLNDLEWAISQEVKKESKRAAKA